MNLVSRFMLCFLPITAQKEVLCFTADANKFQENADSVVMGNFSPALPNMCRNKLITRLVVTEPSFCGSCQQPTGSQLLSCVRVITRVKKIKFPSRAFKRGFTCPCCETC